MKAATKTVSVMYSLLYLQRLHILILSFLVFLAVECLMALKSKRQCLLLLLSAEKDADISVLLPMSTSIMSLTISPYSSYFIFSIQVLPCVG